MSPIDISKQIGMSAERVRQIRNEALDKLRFAANVILT